MSDLAPLLIVVVAGRALVRAGLRAMLADRPDIQVVGEAVELAQAIDLALATSAEAIVADSTPYMERIIGPTQVFGPESPLLVLVGDPPQVSLGALIAAGVRGILPADADGDSVADTLQAVRRGLIVLDPSVVPALTEPHRGISLSADSLAEPLTEREHEVLRILALGLPNKLIAQRLGISEHTVKFHVAAILAKLGAASRTEAVTMAIRQGALTL